MRLRQTDPPKRPTYIVGGMEIEEPEPGIDRMAHARHIARRYRDMATRSDALDPAGCLAKAEAIERGLADGV